MARKNYPFHKRDDNKMTNLVSGLITGLFVAPIATIDAVSNIDAVSKGNKDTIKNSKKDALFGLALGILFLTPLYCLFIFIGLIIPIIGEVLIVFSSTIFLCVWYIIISDLIKVYKKK